MESASLITGLSAGSATMHLITAALYLAVAVAGLAEAPRDERTRVFLGLAISSLVATGVIATMWLLGVKDDLAFGRLPLALWFAALAAATLSLFHFSQVFPRRRPWITNSGPQLPLAYLLTPIAVVALVRLAPIKGADASGWFVALSLVFGFPLVILLAFVLPVATIVSLGRSYREAVPVPGQPDPRPALGGILTSVLVGAAVGLLIQGPLEAAAPESLAARGAGVVVWLLGLVTPLAYAAGIWKYKVLQIPPAGEP